MPDYSNDLTRLIANIESSGGQTSPNVFQQGPAFVDQFGGGEAGVMNFVNQALKKNPDISVGDLYAEYNQGTGHPGSGATYNQLAVNNAPAFRNLNRNLGETGINALTPASDLISGTSSSRPSPVLQPVSMPAEVGPADLASAALSSPTAIANPVANNNVVERMAMFSILQGMMAGHKFVPVEYDPWKIAGLKQS